MPVTLINPRSRPEIPLYHHVAVATGTRHVHVAGQVAWDEHGQLVGPGDLAAQVVQVLRNAASCLEAAGATFDDVVRMTWYAAGWRREMYEAFEAGIALAGLELDLSTPPAALIGVDVLFEPGILVELEVTAVLD